MWQILLSEKFPPTGFMKGKYKSCCLVSGATLSCARSSSLAVTFIRAITQHCRGCTCLFDFYCCALRRVLADHFPPLLNPSILLLSFLSISVCSTYPDRLVWGEGTLNQCDTEIWGSLSPRTKPPQSSVSGLNGFTDRKDEKGLAEQCLASEPSLGAVAESQDDLETDLSQFLPFLLYHEYLYIWDKLCHADTRLAWAR